MKPGELDGLNAVAAILISSFSYERQDLLLASSAFSSLRPPDTSTDSLPRVQSAWKKHAPFRNFGTGQKVFCGEAFCKPASTAMRFYFDVHHDQETDRDTLGIEAPSLDAAVRYVVATMQDFVSEDRQLAARINCAMVEITDREENSVVVSFADVFKNMGNYGSDSAGVGKSVATPKNSVLTAHPRALRLSRARPAVSALPPAV